VEVETAIVQGNQVSFPLERAAIACGNRVALPGAFSLNGPGPAWVCLLTGNPLPDRDTLLDPATWPVGAACVPVQVLER
jgi:hypothetical protein